MKTSNLPRVPLDMAFTCLTQRMAAAGLRIVTVSPTDIAGPESALEAFEAPYKALSSALKTQEGESAPKVLLRQSEAWLRPGSLASSNLPAHGATGWEKALYRDYIGMPVFIPGGLARLQGVFPASSSSLGSTGVCVVTPLGQHWQEDIRDLARVLLKDSYVLPSIEVSPSAKTHQTDPDWGLP